MFAWGRPDAGSAAFSSTVREGDDVCAHGSCAREGGRGLFVPEAPAPAAALGSGQARGKSLQGPRCPWEARE